MTFEEQEITMESHDTKVMAFRLQQEVYKEFMKLAHKDESPSDHLRRVVTKYVANPKKK